ncbi:MAG: AAA family ATPase [Blautia sp.]|nr:AAA family ATPase [Blautia sp.]
MEYMQERWTPEAERVLDMAVLTAASLHHNYVGTEHLLAGLLAVKDTVAEKTLRGFSVEPAKLLELIRKLIAPQEETKEEKETSDSDRTDGSDQKPVDEKDAEIIEDQADGKSAEETPQDSQNEGTPEEGTNEAGDQTIAVQEKPVQDDETGTAKLSREGSGKNEAAFSLEASLVSTIKELLFGSSLTGEEERKKAFRDEKKESSSQNETSMKEKDEEVKAEKTGPEETGTEETGPEETRTEEASGLQEGTGLDLIPQSVEDFVLSVKEMGTEPRNSPRLEFVLEEALADAQARRDDAAGTAHLLLAMLRQTDCVATRLLITMDVNIQQLYSSVLTSMGLDKQSVMREVRELGGEEGTSLTPTLDKFSRDLTVLAAEGRMDPIIGREKEISRLIQVLSRRTKNNPCLVGEPGVGKTAIVEGLAQRIVKGQVPESMLDRRVVMLDMSGMVAGTKYRGEFEERIHRVIEEVCDHPGILLFLDELHTIIGAGGAEGSLDAANILKPALSRGELQVIGATTLEEYRKYIEKDAALERRFAPVTVEEPSQEETVSILKGLRPMYEEHHGVQILDEALEAAVAMSVRYISDRFLPDKAIDVMDEAAARTRLYHNNEENTAADGFLEKNREKEEELEEALRQGDIKLAYSIRLEQTEARKAFEEERNEHLQTETEDRRVVGETEIAAVISDWTKVPVQQLTEKESERLAHLEEELHKRVIGQEDAVKAVALAVKRGRVGLKDPRRPIGSFLFLGPTGVGKTELSKALAEAVFGSEQNMIRVDMSEYMEKHSVSKLIGSPPGYVGFDEGGQLSEKVRRNPYSVILFDEIEKAHPDVFNILLQVLDDGHITDAHGRKVNFKQTIIIMTSNAGAASIVEPKRLGFVSGSDEKQDYERMKSGVMEEVKRIFRPEFLNRIDEIMVFHMLNEDEIRAIVNLMFKELTDRCEKQMRIHLEIAPEVCDEIAKAGFDPKYGARPLRRQIQTRIEDLLATQLLEGKVHTQDKVRIELKDGEIEMNVV